MIEEAPSASDHARDLLLSPREAEVLALMSQGLTNQQLAGQLNVSVHAVKFHLAAIYRKLGVANRTEAAVTYLRGVNRVPGDDVPGTS